MESVGGSMSEHFCSLIILGPGSSRTLKLHLFRGAITVLICAFLLSFLAVIWLGYKYPVVVDAPHRQKLEAENQALKAETTNAVLGIKKLNERVVELEEKSRKVEEMVVPGS
jgi:cell division protein FtsB